MQIKIYYGNMGRDEDRLAFCSLEKPPNPRSIKGLAVEWSCKKDAAFMEFCGLRTFRFSIQIIDKRWGFRSDVYGVFVHMPFHSDR